MPRSDLIDSVQPIVLAGGSSRRFGRDKLREPVEGGWLIDRPIGALREVFGLRVAIVGECDAEIARRADRVIEDRFPGAGPIGGVLSALEASDGPVFVLAGDLSAIDADTVRTLVDQLQDAQPEICSIIARADRPEPCVGLYLPSAIACLHGALDRRCHGLLAAISAERRLEVVVDASRVINVNSPGDIERAC